MKQMKFIVALLFLSFCFSANAKSTVIDCAFQETSEKTAMNTQQTKQTLDIAGANFLDRDNTVIMSNFNFRKLKPDKSIVALNLNDLYKVTKYGRIESSSHNSSQKYKPHINGFF